MAQYFDKTFFKFLFGFIAIIAVSVAVIFATRAYDASSTPDPNINIATP